MYEYKQDGNALTDPPVYLDWRNHCALFGMTPGANLSDRHLTNYQDAIVTLHNTWDANKASAHANAELIAKLRKKIKKAKKALRN